MDQPHRCISKNYVWSGVGERPRVGRVGYVPVIRDPELGRYVLVVGTFHPHGTEEQGLSPKAQHLTWSPFPGAVGQESWVQGLGELK